MARDAATLTSAPQRAATLVRDAVSAAALGLSSLGMAISMAALIFAGPLEPTLPRAIGSFVLAGALITAITALRSQFVPVAAIVQDAPSVVMVTVAASVVASGAEPADVLVLLVVSTFLTGVVMWLMGRFGLGALVRYVPTTVVGAFVAGTGWILVKGGVDVMVGFGLGLGDIADLFGADLLGRWVPGVALGVGVWLVGRSDRLPPVAMSLAIVASVAGFFVVVAAASSVDAVESGGWLIGPFPSNAGLDLLSTDELGNVDWGGLLAVSPGVLSVVAVAVLVMLLNVTGLESISQDRVDVDAELRLAGFGNIVTSPLGCVSGFIGLADTVLLERMGVRNRAVTVIAAAMAAVAGVAGLQLIGYVPRLVVGALLVTVGVALLVEWLAGLVRMVSKVEQVLSIGIVLVIAFVGILEGIGAGVVAACAVFIVRYSRIDPVRGSGTGHGMRSRVDRSPTEVAALTASANGLLVFELQGYLFFGSLTTLEERIRSASAGREVDATVLDFRAVSGIDASGYEVICAAVSAIQQQASGAVVISGLDADLRDALIASDAAAMSEVVWTDTLDEALERTEELQLERHGPAPMTSDGVALSDALLREFTAITFAAGDDVMTQGDPSTAMFVVRRGTLTAFKVDVDGQRHRLRRFGAGAMIGEMGVITGAVRSADIVADTDVDALELSLDAYTRLRRVSPHLAFELHDFIMAGQAARVVSLSEGIARLSK